MLTDVCPHLANTLRVSSINSGVLADDEFVLAGFLCLKFGNKFLRQVLGQALDDFSEVHNVFLYVEGCLRPLHLFYCLVSLLCTRRLEHRLRGRTNVRSHTDQGLLSQIHLLH